MHIYYDIYLIYWQLQVSRFSKKSNNIKKEMDSCYCELSDGEDDCDMAVEYPEPDGSTFEQHERRQSPHF